MRKLTSSTLLALPRKTHIQHKPRLSHPTCSYAISSTHGKEVAVWLSRHTQHSPHTHACAHTHAHAHTRTHAHAHTHAHTHTHTHTHTLLFGSVCAHLSAGRMSEWGQLQYSIMQKLMGNTYVLTTKHLERRPASHTQNQTSTKLPSYQEHTAYDEN